MSRVKEAIDELIEESYLRGLSEEEIREDFKRFIEACCDVVQSRIKNGEVVSSLAQTLAREKTCILIADRNEGVALLGGDTAPAETFAERVAHRKRLILKTLADCDPHLVRLIDEHRFQGNLFGEDADRPVLRLAGKSNFDRLRLTLLRVGYVATIAIIVILIYLGFIQRT